MVICVKFALILRWKFNFVGQIYFADRENFKQSAQTRTNNMAKYLRQLWLNPTLQTFSKQI